MEAGKKSINDIFNGNRILEIPFFQRAYVWEEEQWERLLQDMEMVTEFNSHYFLGSIILKQKSTVTNQNVGDIRTIIDGQQRLTTLSIFFKVLCLKKNDNVSFNRVFKLMNNKTAIDHNHNDIENFNKIMELENEDNIETICNVTGAYNYFSKEINLDKVNFQTILSKVMFVSIDLGENEDEQQIFDTINSLGVRLTTAELLKNYFFDRNDLGSYETYWKSIFEKDLETKSFWDKEITAGRISRNNIDLFFYSYLQIKLQDQKLKVKTDDKKRLSKVEGLFESYKEFIKKYEISKDDMIKEIKKFALLYKENIDFGVVDTVLTNEYGIERINAIIFGLDNTTIIPYVLYVLKNVNDINEKNEIFKYLESYIMRRIVTHATNKNYNYLFSDELISNQCLTASNLRDIIEKKSDKENYMPTDHDLGKGFHESKLINKQAKGILYFIETCVRDRNRHSTTLLGLQKYSLEHIMPKKWENNWKDNLSTEEKNERNRILLTFGNLTIITSSLNKSIRDSSWNVKKEGTINKPGLNIYASGLETFSHYLSKEFWNEETIKDRANFLFDKSKNVWPYK